MKQDHTHIAVILDRSGSMESILEDKIGGFNWGNRERNRDLLPWATPIRGFGGTCVMGVKCLPPVS
jgi:hypothetical protein